MAQRYSIAPSSHATITHLQQPRQRRGSFGRGVVVPDDVVPRKLGVRLLERSHPVAALPLVRIILVVQCAAVVKRTEVGARRFVILLVLCP